VTPLPHCYTLTISSQQHKDAGFTASQFQEWREDILKQCQYSLSIAFGGCTFQEGKGSYVSDAGELIVEDVTIVTAYADDAAFEKDKSYSPVIRSLAWGVCFFLKQECVLFTVDGAAYLYSIGGDK
jgi:hypothetical protein